MRACSAAIALLLASNAVDVGASPTRPSRQASARSVHPLQARRLATTAANGITLVAETFSGNATAANAWTAVGGACLTAGTSGTPATSIPACGSRAPVDPAGSGALQLTTNAGNQTGMVVTTAPIATSGGLQITFTDYSFNGSNPGGTGLTLFLTDASQPSPNAAGATAGSLGYANGNMTGVNVAGIANAYVGFGFDEAGNFSAPTQARNGGPGTIPESIAVRGAAATGWKYLGGYLNSAGTAASLPFSFNVPAATTRPAAAPTVTVTLTPAGVATAAIDRHDGRGAIAYYSQSIVGLNGEPSVPANVYVGFSAATGNYTGRHQVGGFSVATLGTTATPTPSAFSPASVANLAAWYDASTGATVGRSGSSVTAWNDQSGHGETLAQATASKAPTYVASGINGLGSVSFAGAQYLFGNDAAFSTKLFNESTVFAVTNQSAAANSTPLWSGAYFADPHWTLRLTDPSQSHFDFNNREAGRIAVTDQPLGAALWSAGGSVTNKAQYLRKNGNLLANDAGPGTSSSGNYALAVGATVTAGAGPASYFYTGQIGEVVVYNRYLSNAESAEVEGYLACKWGLQNRLPANHPYRTTCPQGGTYPSQPTPAPAAGALTEPPEIRSSNGSLTFNVQAQADPSTGNPEFLYNGSNVPPTLRVLPGDTLNVTLVNALPTPPSGAGYTNNTNLHYHGLHVSPQAPGDDSIDMIAAPGQTLTYHVTIPANHPTGLYWYHTHAHAETERQTLAGMSGALIVDGIVTTAPQVAGLPERVLVVRDAPLPGSALPNAAHAQLAAMKWAMAHGIVMHGGTPRASAGAMRGMAMAPPKRGVKTELHAAFNGATRNPYVTIDKNYRRFLRTAVSTDGQCAAGAPGAVRTWTVNGQTQPSIGIRPGEQQFWRVVNAGADTYLDLQVDNTTMNVVALDGVPLGNGVGTPTSMQVSHWVLPPASRVEFTITGPPSGTTAYLRTNCFDSGAAGQPMPAAVLATINPNASSTDLRRLARTQRFSPTARRVRFRSAASLRALAVSNTRTIFYSDQNTINGVAYDPAAPPMFYVQSGTTEEWTIQNNSSQVHTFHIHQVHFVVEAINGVAQAQQYVMDNVNVPAATSSGPGSVKVLLDFTDPTIVGTFLLHCHILSHEDGGMMAKIRVGTAPPLQLSAPNVTFASTSAGMQNVTISGGAAPYSVSGCSTVAGAAVNGSTLSLLPSGAGTCVLTIADASNPSITATLTVTVNAGAPAVTLSPNTVSFATPTSTAQSIAINGGTAPYGLSGCSGIALGSLNGQTLTVTPQAAGACTMVITDAGGNTASLAIAVNNAATGNPPDNLTFHQNAMRTGWYKNETTLTTANVAGTSFGAKASLTAPSGMTPFGKVYAQPLYVTNELGPDGLRHNLVVIATSTDQVYAFDETTRAVVWHRDYTNAAAGIRQQLWSDSSCSDINPNIGITGTPVIDRALDEMFFVTATNENGTPFLRLHAVALSSGREIAATVISGSVTLATGGPASIDPLVNNERSALLEANGNIYVTLASHCDYGSSSTHGWVLAYNNTTLQETGSLVDLTNANPGNNYFLGSPWMGGYGPAADANGNIYFATGNGAYDGVNSFSMSVMKVPGNLNLGAASFFTPATALTDSNADEDLGSGGVMLLPDQAGTPTHLLVQGGKCGAAGCLKYILNRDAMGGQQTGDAGAVWKGDTGGGIWGGPAYFQDAKGLQYIVYGTGQPLNTYVLTSPVGLSVQSSANVGCLECRDTGSQPVVSSNGTTAGTAIVWALKTPGNAGGSIVLYAFDALNMGHTLFSGTAGSWTQASGTQWIGGALVSPLVANGRVYVPVDGAVTVFGLQ